MTESTTATDVTYEGYLGLPTLLRLQQVLSNPEHPDELYFIVVHQATELWYKVILHDLARVIVAIDRNDWPEAVMLMRRINHALDTCIAQLTALHHLPPENFHQFRSHLGTASGMQSVQFRELELRSGLRQPEYLASLRRLGGGTLHPALALRLKQRSLVDAHMTAAERLGMTAWADVCDSSGPQGGFRLLSEVLLDYDVRWARWRDEHMLVVERVLGGRARGTGGSVALKFLAHRARFRFFPYLWEARNEVCARSGGDLHPCDKS